MQSPSSTHPTPIRCRYSHILLITMFKDCSFVLNNNNNNNDNNDNNNKLGMI